MCVGVAPLHNRLLNGVFFEKKRVKPPQSGPPIALGRHPGGVKAVSAVLKGSSRCGTFTGKLLMLEAFTLRLLLCIGLLSPLTCGFSAPW